MFSSQRSMDVFHGTLLGSVITALLFFLLWSSPSSSSAPQDTRTYGEAASKAHLLAALATQPGYTSLQQPLPESSCPLSDPAWTVAHNARHGFDLVTYGPTEFISRYCLRGGDAIFFEEHETDLIKALLSSAVAASAASSAAADPADPFFSRPWLLDIGANLGVHTVSVGSAGYGVIAIEANPTTGARLHCSIQKNSLPHVTLFKAAVVGADGPPSVCMQTPEDTNRGTAFVTRGDCPAGAASVPTFQLDAFFAALPPALPAPTVLKMDIEGFELYALRAGSSWLRRTPPPFVLIEVQPDLLARAGARFQDLITFWLELGYHAWIPSGSTRQPLPEVLASDFDAEDKLAGFKWRMLGCSYNMIFTRGKDFPVELPARICENTR